MTGSLLDACLMAYWLLSVVLLLATSCGAILQPRLSRRRRVFSNRPPISILIPLKDDSPGLFDATLSAVNQIYPQFDLTFASADPESPAVQTARRAAAQFAGRCRVVQSGPDERILNPKLRNLQAGLAVAEHDLILSKDSGTHLSLDMLNRMVEQMGDNVGLVVAVPILRRPRSFPAWVECAIVNTQNARMLLAASSLGLGFGLGAVMLFRSSDLRRAGGIVGIGHEIADDQAMSSALARIGLRTTFADQTVDQLSLATKLGEVIQRHVRWAICRRTQTPVVFAAEPLCGACLPAIAAAASMSSPGGMIIAALASVMVWVIVEIGLALAKGWPLSSLYPLGLLGRELLAPLIWIKALAARQVLWGETVIPISSRKGRQI